MSDLLAAILQGIAEGLTEFLPVSSTAHIVMTQELLGLPRSDSFWKMFAVVIQLGAILAVVAYFWKRILQFVNSFFVELRANSHDGGTMDHLDEDDDGDENRPNSTRSIWFRHPLPLVLISFFVTALPCFLIDKLIGENLESLWVIGVALVVGGFAMYAIDTLFSARATTGKIEHVTLKQAIVIGLAQILAAAFPGTSRSMSTIAGGQVMGLSRSAALEFSFFLSIPVMFAAAGFKLLQFILKGNAIPSAQWVNLGAGFVTSFIVALAVIAWFMNWVRTRGFTPFAIYRVLVGSALIVWSYYRPTAS
jgi:undecaprenyl-diphosphatase